jgi:aminoglycoside phosphotransferase (APT) family kinase protein
LSEAAAEEHWIATRIGAYLSERWRERAPVRVTAIQRIPGGASRETWRLQVAFGSGDDTRGLILRRDPETSLIETERAAEYAAYAAVWRSGLVPVPEPLLLEADSDWLRRPFTLMAEIPGCATAIGALPEDDRREAIGREFWTLLGRLTQLDPLADAALCQQLPVPDPADCAAQALTRWTAVIRDDALKPEPVAAAAQRWLERNLPPPAQRLCLVHGDYRSGNFLFSPDGRIEGVLDWEMAHIGDPYEDLAWSLDPVWCWPETERAGRLLPRAQAVACWQAASGLAFDPEVFRWWAVFASFKALAIWISSTEDFAGGAGRAPILALAGWVLTDRQRRILLERIDPRGRHRYTEAWP